MPTAKKAEEVQHLVDELSQSRLAILTDYRGLTVAEIGRLRRQLRDANTKLEVSKNTLVRRAAAEIGVDSQIEKLLAGPTALAFVHQTEIAQTAKALSDYARLSKVFTIKGAVLGKSVLNAEQVQQLADLPPREVLLARVVGGMQAPISGIVTVLGGTLRGLVYALNARKEQLAAQQGG